MVAKAQVWIAKKEDLGDINTLIDFLEWSREMLKIHEGAELTVHYQPEDNALEYGQLNGRDGPIRRIQLGGHTY